MIFVVVLWCIYYVEWSSVMFNCMYICTYVIGYVKIILKSIVSHRSKRTGYQICLFLMYICIFICI